ncbi:MAG: histidine kinase dimerization/phosphoacceptor domain -containing protein [Balneolaceae bacterium]|nr:histidine kinase dimerization/phosphoacceptor domain -containing protein [Balneolaceae bacterium]
MIFFTNLKVCLLTALLSVCVSASALGSLQSAMVADSALTPLHRVKLDKDADGIADMMGDTIRVTGIANVSTGVLHGVYFQIFIQNDSTGLPLFNRQIDEPVNRGDSLVVTGVVRKYFGMTELNVVDYEVYEPKQDHLEPVPLQEAIKNKPQYEGMLVSGQGVVRKQGSRHNGKYLEVAPSDTSQQSMIVYVTNFNTYYEEIDLESFSSGDVVQVTGILSLYNPGKTMAESYELFLRTPADIDSQGLKQNTLATLAIVGGVIILLALGWIMSLRIQVKNKTRQIQQALEEKDMLLKEIHHRVKNNLAIVSGLIELQMDGSLSEDAQKVLQDSQSRIQSMALVHDKLYRTTSLSDIGMQTYLEELVQSLQSTFSGMDSDITINFDIDEINMGIDKAIPCGLLVNELVVNAFKHAFGDQQGNLTVKLKDLGDNYKLIIADDGQGLPEDFGNNDGSSLGMLLIKTFTSQLDAEMQVKNADGAHFAFIFPPENGGDERIAQSS